MDFGRLNASQLHDGLNAFLDPGISNSRPVCAPVTNTPATSAGDGPQASGNATRERQVTPAARRERERNREITVVRIARSPGYAMVA
jgi:hypothetical protein